MQSAIYIVYPLYCVVISIETCCIALILFITLLACCMFVLLHIADLNGNEHELIDVADFIEHTNAKPTATIAKNLTFPRSNRSLKTEPSRDEDGQHLHRRRAVIRRTSRATSQPNHPPLTHQLSTTIPPFTDSGQSLHEEGNARQMDP